MHFSKRVFDSLVEEVIRMIYTCVWSLRSLFASESDFAEGIELYE